ncbi:MAG: translation initiation factor [Mariprofundaceae bacterium]|nr:translation initiation factor [Mariprofundaceae bacterium]
MSDNHRLVYSTEHGQIDKSAQTDGPQRGKRHKKNKQTASAASSIKNPAKQGVRIRREAKGRGGKTVCVIEGLNIPELQLKALLKRLKSKLGTGGAIKNGSIEIQGDHREKLLALLAAEGHKAKLAGG